MKKRMVVLCGCIAAMMSVQVTAAPSVTGSVDNNQVYVEEQTTEEGAEEEKQNIEWVPEITVENYTEEVLDLIEKVKSATAEDTVLSTIGETFDLTGMLVFDEEGKLMDEEEMEAIRELLDDTRFLSELMELRLDKFNPTEENPVKVTFTLNNMTEDMEVYSLYLCKEHEWEMIRSKKTDENQVVIPFHSGTSLCALVYNGDVVEMDEFEVIIPGLAEETEA